MIRPLAVLVTLILGLAACGGDGDDDDVGAGGAGGDDTELVGLLGIAPGACDAAGAVTGSWFRMVQPGGTVDAGPFVANADSSCVDQNVSPLTPGTDGGLRVGDYQPQPDAPFTADGTSAAGAVIAPQGFFAVRFGISTNERDPQSGEQVPAPAVLVASDGSIDADLSAFSVSWNGQFFNQGAPKPGAADPRTTGTYDEASGAYTLDWTSTVDGGPFDGFTGVWHLEGTFQPTEATS